MNSIRIALADDHTLFRGGIKGILQSDPEFTIKVEAANGQELLDKIRRQKVDVVVTDVSMPDMDGEEVTRIINRDFSTLPVIALSMHNNLYHIKRMLAAGAKGYVVKSANPPELLASVRKVLDGGLYFCNGTLSTLALEVVKPNRIKEALFTERELAVLSYIFNECADQEIAEKLDVTLKTVANIRRELYHKTGCKTLVGLIKWTIANNVI